MSLGLNLGLGLGSRGVFNPLTLFAAGEQGYWLDPSDFSTMSQDSAGTTPVTTVGQRVGRILDKSGRGNHFTQATNGKRPTLEIDTSGRYYLEFDGTNDFLQSAADVNPGAVDKVQVFAGVRKLSDATLFQAIVEASIDWSANNGAFIFSATGNEAATYYAAFRGGGGLTSGFAAPSAAAPTTDVLTLTGDIAGDSVVLRANGVQLESSSADLGTSNFLSYPHFIGMRGGVAIPLNGRIYQLITRYGPNLSAAQIAAAEGFVNLRTGAF